MGALVLVGLSSACDGGSPSVDQGRVAGASRAEFIAKVDEICAGDRSALEDIDPPRNLKESGPFLRQVLPVIRDQIAAIRELGEPPAERRDVYLEWVQARDGIVKTTVLMIEAAESGDEQEFQTLAAAQRDLDTAADKAAAEYGFEVCGSSDSGE